MHDALFELQDSLGSKPWHDYAVRAGLTDTGAFNQCMAAPHHVDRLRRDSLAASTVQLDGTPTVVVNEWRLWETPTSEVITRMVRKELGLM